MSDLLLIVVPRSRSTVIAAAGLMVLPAASLFAPQGVLPAWVEGSGSALAFLGALAGGLLSMSRLDRWRWPVSTIGGGVRAVLGIQATSCFLLSALVATPSLLVNRLALVSVSSDLFDMRLLCAYCLVIAHTASLGVFLLQLRIPTGLRSIGLVLLAWALPSIAPPNDWLWAPFHSVFGASLSLVAHPQTTWSTWGSHIPSIVVLLGSARLAAELQQRRQ